MSSSSTLKALAQLQVSKHQIPAHGLTPNTSIQNRPLMIYHGAFPDASAGTIESHLRKIGVVEPAWRYTMYSQSHFHSTSHEVLCVFHGSAKLCFGGEENEGRIEPKVQKGDVIVVPAGVAHRLLVDDGGFQMVGSYPKGYDWDMCYGRAGEEKKIEGISKIPWFEKDPIYGDEGPATSLD